MRSIRLEEADRENKVLLSTDFSATGASLTAAGKGSFRGGLPENWKEDYTHFIRAEVSTEPGKRGTERFLRFHVNGAGAQFQAPLQALEAGRYYRLTFTGDNRTGEPLAFSLRQIASPYTLLAYASANGSSGWKTQTLTFAVDRAFPAPPRCF